MEISQVTQSSVAAVASNTPVTPENKEAAQSRPQSTTTDTVQISAAAKALEEANETAVQTAQEANNGDVQAQRKQAAYESSVARVQETQATLGIFQ